MVIKNLTHKRFFLKKMMEYVNNQKKSPNSPPIYWNIPFPSEKGTYKAFQSQDQLLKQRKNGNRMLHDILSFSPDDTKHLNDQTITNLCYHYLQLRAPKNIAFGQIHIDKGHYHVHLIISPNEYGCSKVTTFNKQQYLKIRHDLEQYQIKHFPELQNSIVFLNQKEKSKSQPNKEYQTKTRTGTTDKELLKSTLDTCLKNSANKDEFFAHILQNKMDLEIYTYRGKQNGIIYKNKKYRFQTLGIKKEHLLALEQKETSQVRKQLKALQQLQKQKNQTLDLNR